VVAVGAVKVMRVIADGVVVAAVGVKARAVAVVVLVVVSAVAFE
jgi:hypothetical protein